MDAAGGLRAEHQLPRQFELDGVSVLPADDDAYLAAAPTCAEDLQVLADYPVSKGCTSPFAPVWIAEIVRRRED